MTNVNLRYGIFLGPHHPVDEDPTYLIHRDFELMEWIDKLGFAEAWIGEHHSGGFELISSPELFIAAAAERTKHLKFGLGVVSLPYHNPLMVANRVIQLDHQTRGRVMFGAGPGLLEGDTLMMGIDSLKKRDRMAEGLAVILRLMSGEWVTEKTEWYDFTEAHVQLLPYTKPYPEVAVASVVTPSGGRLAGKHDLSMLCMAALGLGFDALDTNWKVAQEIAAENGRTMDPNNLRLVVPWYIAETRQKAREDVQFAFTRWLDYQRAQDATRYNVPAGEDPIDWYVGKNLGVIGTPDDVIAVIERLQAKQGPFGCFCQYAADWADWEGTKNSYELFARYVKPHFNNSNVNRQASLEWLRRNNESNAAKQRAAADAMFVQHNAERSERRNKGGSTKS